jgi:transposase-like protein
MAHELAEHILILFATAVLRYRQGIPDRCPFCGSYHFELWADEPGALVKPRCRSCGWVKTDE